MVKDRAGRTAEVRVARKKRRDCALIEFKELTRDLMAASSDLTSAASLAGDPEAYILGQTMGASAAAHNRIACSLIEREEEA